MNIYFDVPCYLLLKKVFNKTFETEPKVMCIFIVSIGFEFYILSPGFTLKNLEGEKRGGRNKKHTLF